MINQFSPQLAALKLARVLPISAAQVKTDAVVVVVVVVVVVDDVVDIVDVVDVVFVIVVVVVVGSVMIP